MPSEFSKILNDIGRFLVPERCFGCNALLYRGEQLLCAFCRNELPLTDYSFTAENAADLKLYGRIPFKKASSFLRYQEGGLVQRLIHALKYRRQEQIGELLGRWYGWYLKADPGLPQIDWVVPVPLHPRKKRRRGYNQCTRFGQEIAGYLEARYTERHLLRRRFGHSQTREGREVRALNALEAFYVPSPGQLNGCRVLLVDDVITTGATLEGCSNALYRWNAGIELYIATMAVVP